MAKAENLSITNMDDMLVLAEDIKKFISANRLSTSVQGKDFPQAEAWQYAGNRLGIVPKAGHLTNYSDSTEIKYEASIILIDVNNNYAEVGKGYAICSNKEQGKKYYQEYAIASMAQTRAIGKAYRILLSFVMRLAGYEPTPAEEMDGYDTNKEDKKPKEQPAKVEGTSQPTREAVGQDVELTELRGKYLKGLNHELITHAEKTKAMLKMNQLTVKELSDKIEALKQEIKKRQNKQG